MIRSGEGLIPMTASDSAWVRSQVGLDEISFAMSVAQRVGRLIMFGMVCVEDYGIGDWFDTR